VIDFGVATGNVVASETEEEIFRILGTFPVIKIVDREEWAGAS
jgi:hypothetical protein